MLKETLSIVADIEAEEAKEAQIIKQIEEQTRELQEQLVITRNKIKGLKQVQQDIVSDIVCGDFEGHEYHIVERFYLWLTYSEKSESSWIIDSGPLRENIFDDWCNRHASCSVVDQLVDYLWDRGLDDVGKKENIETNIAKFDSMPETESNMLYAIMEDAISQNVDVFTYDW